MTLSKNYTPKTRAALRLAINGKTITRATKLALVVGSILVLINQGDTISAGHSPDWLKVALTFVVPYCVSTWTSVAKDLETVFSSSHK
ncbi:MAG: nitrate/nitrite transporter NrtS [Porticoccaceae bacterium]